MILCVDKSKYNIYAHDGVFFRAPSFFKNSTSFAGHVLDMAIYNNKKMSKGMERRRS